MKVLLLLCALSIFGAVLAADPACQYQATKTNSIAVGAATKLNIAATASQYSNFEFKWIKAPGSNLGVSALVCTDSSDDARMFDTSLAVVGDSINLNLIQTAFTTSTSTGGSNMTSTTSTMTSSTTGTSTTSASSVISPSNMLYFILASLFALPKKRFSFAVLLVAVVIFMASDMATAYPTATTKVTITVAIPSTVTTVCVAGKCGPIAQDYFSLFGRRFTAAGGINVKCDNVTVYPVPYGWQIAPNDPITLATAIYPFWGAEVARAYLIVIANGEGYEIGKYGVKNGQGVYIRKPNNNTYPYGAAGYDYGSSYCDTVVVFTQPNDPVDNSTDIMGPPRITNFITFGGFDYAVADNAAVSNKITGPPNYSVWINPDTTWNVITPAQADAATVAVSAPTITFGTDCFLFSDSSAIDNVGNPCFSKRTLSSFAYGNGNVYYTDSSYGKPLIRRPSTLPDTIPRKLTINEATACNSNSKIYSTLTNLPFVGITNDDMQTQFMTVPDGYRLTTPAELQAMISKEGWNCFQKTYCLATSGYTSAGRNVTLPCGSVITKNVNGVPYYLPSQNAEIVIIKN